MALASLLAAAQAPAQASLLAFPFLLAITALGYVGGMSLPHKLHRVVHPVIVCGAAPNLGALLLGAATGEGYWDTLRRYLTKVSRGGCLFWRSGRECGLRRKRRAKPWMGLGMPSQHSRLASCRAPVACLAMGQGTCSLAS